MRCNRKRLIAAFCGWSTGILHAQQPEMKELLPPHGELQPTFWQQHGWQMGLGIAGALGLIVLGVAWLRRPRALVVETPGTMARNGLEKLRGHVQDGALVTEVSRILRRYVMAALDLGAEELTTTELAGRLNSNPRIAGEVTSEVGNFLRRCDEWKFSLNRPAQELNAVAKASALIDQVELATAKVAEPETPGVPPKIPASHAG